MTKKVFAVAAITGIILGLHYFTLPYMKYQHSFYRMLFYLPLVLGAIWFGLKGALGVTGAIVILYIPYVAGEWEGFSFEVYDRFLEGVLFLFVAFLLGFLVERERKKHQALIRSERLAAMGMALSEVAHDMKTPLIAIGGFAQQVYNKLEASDLNRKKLNVIIQETARLEMMVKGMLDFGRPIELKRLKIDLNQLIDETLEVIDVVAKQSGIALKRDLEPSLPPLLLDPSGIRQALINLITNAIQASPPDADVWISTRQSNGKVVLGVMDNGCGIPEEYAKKIFQPFVSKKKGGTGLGLAIVKKIVDVHGGEVFLSLNSGKGVTFSVSFPVI